MKQKGRYKKRKKSNQSESAERRSAACDEHRRRDGKRRACGVGAERSVEVFHWDAGHRECDLQDDELQEKGAYRTGIRPAPGEDDAFNLYGRR